MAQSSVSRVARKQAAKVDQQRATSSGEVITLTGKDASHLIDERLIKAAVSKALAEMDAGSKYTNSAEQRMTYAVYCEYDQIVARNVKLASLSQMEASKESRDEMLAHLVPNFIGDKLKNADDEDGWTAQKLWDKRRAMIVRACKLAGVLSSLSIGADAFNEEMGLWQVPFTSLFPADAKMQFTDAQKTRTVFLNRTQRGGTGTKADGSDRTVNVQASVEQFIKVNGKGAPRRTPRQTTPDAAASLEAFNKLSAETMEIIAGDEDAQTKMAVALAAAFADNAGADDNWENYNSDFRNALTTIAKHYDRLNQIEAETAKPATKRGKAA